ncbi:Six-hairpin glycosidase-like protein [Chytridium lagenaria]|nr:Six-hairpin glycosidase-like protein [Chytridium lagenaria]
MSRRPSVALRKFSSPTVEHEITRVKAILNQSNKFPHLADVFENCWPNTLDTTVQNHMPLTGNVMPDSFFSHYFPILPTDTKLQDLVLGVILRQAKCLASHPFSNAFRYSLTSPPSHWASDRVHPAIPDDAAVWESKYELDSLAAFLKLAAAFFKIFQGHTSEAASRGLSLAGVKRVVALMVDMQMSTSEEELLGGPIYSFVRGGEVPTDTLMLSGRGPPALRCGMVRSCFRPSDDCNTFPFSVPSNAMACVELKNISDMFDYYKVHPGLSTITRNLSTEIRAAIYKNGIITHPKYGAVFAYEVDGFGGTCIMDDANVPSLLSLPFLGFMENTDPLYLRTRTMVLSDSNPYYFRGPVAEGVGSPHTGIGWIWPMSIIMRVTGNTGFMHESFSKENAEAYTRSWFAWANGMFGELKPSTQPRRTLVSEKDNGCCF